MDTHPSLLTMSTGGREAIQKDISPILQTR